MICPALYDINLLRDFWKINIFIQVLQENKSANSLINCNKIELVTQNKEAAWCHYQVLLWTSPQTHQAQGQEVKKLQIYYQWSKSDIIWPMFCIRLSLIKTAFILSSLLISFIIFRKHRLFSRPYTVIMQILHKKPSSYRNFMELILPSLR